jgi:hypothetical protein
METTPNSYCAFSKLEDNTVVGGTGTFIQRETSKWRLLEIQYSACGVTALDNELLELLFEIGIEADHKHMPCLSKETWHWLGKMGEACRADAS